MVAAHLISVNVELTWALTSEIVQSHPETGGGVACRYWEVDLDCPLECANKRPYRIELWGVTCDPGLAVARGIWRKIRTGRSVPVSQQLRSHRLFAEHWERLAHQVDAATLHFTGAPLAPSPDLHAIPHNLQL